MNFLAFLSSVIALASEVVGLVHDKGTRDYCLLDKFTPQCKDNEVIIINSAIFGRMKANPCISSDGPMGCFANVKGIIEGFCGGKQFCSVDLSDRILLATSPCRNNFNLYYKISYSCIQVLTQKRCNGQNTPVISENRGYISSSVSSEHRHGASKCPWKIKSKDGKQLNVTIQKFSRANTDKGGSNPPVCHSAATVKEGSTVKNVLLCPSDAKNKSIYISQSDNFEINFPGAHDSEESVYLVHFEGIGCVKPMVAKDTHSKRNGNQATIVCNDSKVSWELVCKDDEWHGEEKSCTRGWAFASSVSAEEAPPLGMLLIIVTGIALGVLIGGFLLYLAINAFKRYHGLLPAQQIQNPSYEKPFYNPNKMAYNDRTIQRSSMIYGTNRRSYPNRQMLPPVPPPHADNAQMRPPSEISEANRQSHIYETPLFNSL